MQRNQGRVSFSISACALVLLLAAPPASASDAPSSASGILGEWWTQEKDGRVRFSKRRDGTYMGILTWSKKPRPDTENDNPKLRTRSVVGIVLMWDLRYEDGEYEDGNVYNPEDGNTYRFDAKVISKDKLEIHGYLGIALFGQTNTWTRYR